VGVVVVVLVGIGLVAAVVLVVIIEGIVSVVVVAVVLVVVLEIVVAAAAVGTFVAFGTNKICEASPFDCAARQPLNFASRFAAFSCFLQNGPFSSFLSVFPLLLALRIQTHRLFVNMFFPFPLSKTNPSPCFLF